MLKAVYQALIRYGFRTVGLITPVWIERLFKVVRSFTRSLDWKIYVQTFGVAHSLTMQSEWWSLEGYWPSFAKNERSLPVF